MKIPTFKLNNGLEMPVFGLGTWQAEPGEVGEAVKHAIDCGYRHFDCAYFYGNEKEIGEALRQKISDGTVKREDLFIVSKLWNTYHRPDMVIPACKRTLQNFGLDYIDLYLVHWPFAWKEGDDLLPVDENGKAIPSDVDYLDTWKEMEKCVELGLTKSIGISNFNSEQIERLLKVAKIKPVNNQVEVHPYFNQKKLIKFCRERDITITSYFPLGSPARPFAKQEEPVPLQDPVLKKIAEKYNKSVAQVIFKYLIQIGTAPVPKSSNPKRIKENIDIFDFELSEDDMADIDGLNKDCRLNYMGDFKIEDHKYYPFHLEY